MRQIANNTFFKWVEAEIAEGHSVQFRLKGLSMSPLIRNGKDIVVLRPCSKEELRPMDVVLFRHGNKHLLHRIIERQGDKLLIKGDGSFVAKERCTVDDVIGKVQAVVRPSGKMLSVDSMKWKLLSWLWQKAGVVRIPFLRYIYYRQQR